MRWADIRREVVRVLRCDLRRLRARIFGLGRDHGAERDRSRVSLILKLERAAFYTRAALRLAEGHAG